MKDRLEKYRADVLPDEQMSPLASVEEILMQGCLKRIVVMVLLLGVVFNYRAYAAGLLPEYTGFPLSILYLLSFVIAPLPHKKDSVVLMLSMFAGMAILYVMPGHQMISFFSSVFHSYYGRDRLLLCLEQQPPYGGTGRDCISLENKIYH